MMGGSQSRKRRRFRIRWLITVVHHATFVKVFAHVVVKLQRFFLFLRKMLVKNLRKIIEYKVQ